jgi:hypothetical protein
MSAINNETFIRRAPGSAPAHPGLEGHVGRGHLLLRALAILLALAALAAGIYPLFVRPWQQHWGATAAEVARPMAGDELVQRPFELTTRAVTVNAPAEAIWPWLVQMGNNRGGLYSYDWLDTTMGALDRPSVNRILPEFQNLHEGDLMPYAKGTDMLVKRLVPNRELLLVYTAPDAEVTQSWGLYPLDSGHTRLVIRVRAGLPPGKSPSVRDRLQFALIELTEFPMTRQQLLGIKSRAESLADAGRAG